MNKTKSEYTKLVSQVVKSLRKPLSAKEFSKALGFTSNKVNRWEGAHTQISWLDFIHVCEILKLPLEDCLSKAVFYSGGVNDLKKWIAHLSLSDKTPELLKLWGISRSKLLRWQSKKGSPTLAKVFLIMDQKGLSVKNFLNFLIENKSKKLTALLQTWNPAEEKISAHPLFIGILNLLTLKEYNQIEPTRLPEVLFNKLNIPAEISRNCLHIILESQLLLWDAAQGVYENPENKHFNLEGSRDDLTRSTAFWNYFAQEFINREPSSKLDPNLCSYLTFGCRKEDLPEVRKAFVDFFHKMRNFGNPKGRVDFVFTLNSNLTNINHEFLGRVYADKESEIQKLPLA